MTDTKKVATRRRRDPEAPKKSVAEIVVDRLIEKIQNEKILPWQKPFQSPCMNWYSEREYNGVNTILLRGGEYITFKQLQAYNKQHGTDFSVKGLKTEVVVYFNKREKQITAEEASELIKKGFWRVVRPTDDGTWVRISWFLRYYRVFNIADIPPDSNGNRLEPKIGRTIFEVHTPAEEIIDRYCKATGVKIITSNDGAWYNERLDAIGTPLREYYKSEEAYYRVIFHEMIHSTGIESRLNRECFKSYHMGSTDRSREELIAELGGLLLATEAGFREDTEWAQNSLEYLHGWCDWMRDNKREVLNGMFAADKAKKYILEQAGISTANQLEKDEEDNEADSNMEIEDEE